MRLTPKAQAQVDRLADLLKREPGQVEEACVEGILDLIEAKCEVPLMVMETRLHLKYRNRNEAQDFRGIQPPSGTVSRAHDKASASRRSSRAVYDRRLDSRGEPHSVDDHRPRYMYWKSAPRDEDAGDEPDAGGERHGRPGIRSG